MKKNIIIAGTGFRGFCDAVQLAKNPDYQITMLDPAPFFGGIAYSREVQGFYVDKGVHMFDSIPKELGTIVDEIMNHDTQTIEFVSASHFNGHVTEGFSLPDLSSLEERTKEQIRNELLSISASTKAGSPKNLQELFLKRFGPTAGNIYCDIFKRVYSIGADKIDPSGLAHTSLHRLKFLDDPEMLALKEDSHLDGILAARRRSFNLDDGLISLYPTSGAAMQGWCIKAQKWLEDKGIDIKLGHKISGIQQDQQGVVVKTNQGTFSADKLLWSNDNLTALCHTLQLDVEETKFHHGTPMVFITFILKADKIKDFTYIQNFDLKALTYRTAAAGLYSKQVNAQGLSFVTSECPVDIDSYYWNNPEELVKKAWQEIKVLGVVSEDAELASFDYVCIPATFKPAMTGIKERVGKVYQAVNECAKDVVVRDIEPFFRREIYLDSLDVEQLLD